MRQSLCCIYVCRSPAPLHRQSDVNPELMVSFMSLMADYVRLHLIVASVTERKQALGMYYCAYMALRGSKLTPAMAKVKNITRNIRRNTVGIEESEGMLQ